MRSYRQRVFLFFLAGVGSFCFAAPNPRVVLETNFGNITIELYPDAAPVTVDNFLGYVNSGFYDGLLFHRAIEDFMIQTGKFLYYEGQIYYKDPGAPIINEGDNGLSNVYGTISTALTDVPDSATSQFFINLNNNLHLDYNYPDENGFGHCVFGYVVQGMDVVETIALLPVIQTSFSEAFPNDPMAGMYSAYVLPCEASYCGNLAGDSRIGLEDFALFASHWLSDCGSANSFCNGVDLNYSGGVDIADLALFIEHWTRTAGYEPYFSDLVPDNSINLDDLTALMSHWLDSGCDEANEYCGGADINRNGNVDLIDYSLLSDNWLGSY